jgi:Zn finger protein HypA/HybF involved in hydrogenase expression
MTDWFSCNDCKRAFRLLDDKGTKCPSCGGSNGELLTREQMKKGVEAGAYLSIDLRTGKGSKKKPR